jgi:mono/diheme cytochrome c family protein
MRTPSAVAVLFLAGAVAGGALVAADATGGGQEKPSAGAPAESAVTPVAGPSWLNHLNLTYRDTGLGRGAGRYGPPTAEPFASERAANPPVTRESAALTGADLYRLNCQACHRAEGTGSPPEIKSVLDLVQGSSVELVRRQLQQEGMSVPAATIRKQVTAARIELFRRIRAGGQRMPPLAHLQDADIKVLYAYLTQLAQTPDSPRQSQRTVSWARLGEHVVKGTCHICHDAVGPRPTPDAMLRQGVIPPLAVVLADNSRDTFIWKARKGAPVFEGFPLLHYRGRMPVFYYLRDEELAAAYDFLVTYPPQAVATRHRAMRNH